ncbi:hypothetical protein C8F01DRAFT_1379150 [Mycena amicta]|nr:hypothetical protein C8F01DRAFT_1379150 [Mycena amicta]
MPSRASSAAGSHSKSTSAGAASDTTTTWLDALLLVARLGVETTESAAPAAKAVFQSAVLLLEKIEKLQKNQEALKDICEQIVSTLQMLCSVIQAAHPEVANLQERCLDFQQLLNGISSRIEEIKNIKTSRRQQLKGFILPGGITNALAVYGNSITDMQEQLKLFTVHNTKLVLNETSGGQTSQSGSEFSATFTTTGMSWFEDTFNSELSRSQIEDALARSIINVIQEIWIHLTNPVRATLNHTHNALEKVQALFNHLDAHFGNLVLIFSFQEAVLKWGRIGHMVNHRLQNNAGSQTSDSLVVALASGQTVIQPRFVRDKVQFIRNCPPPSKFFQGRKDILLQLDRFFQPTEQKEQKVVLLYGLGGAGKTQIALKFISDSVFRFRFTDQFKINASSEEAIEMGYKQIALTQNLGDTAEAAQTWLKTNQDEWLLLFDNADKRDLDLGEYLPKCTHGNVLITSRNPQLWSHTGPDKKIIEISNLVVDDAVVLLLKCAGLDTDKHKTQAVAVVKELYCFPLAIIQAGAFISRIPSLHEDISDFIPLYQKNQAALLSKKPEQSQGDYKLTVYTTWEMSFKQLKPAAAEFLQLCSFIHFEGISEDIFKRASEYVPGDGPLDPSHNILHSGLDLLLGFKDSESMWNTLAFGEIISEICSYSLMVWQSNAGSIHPLVHQWSRTMAIDSIGQRNLVVALLGMSAACSVGIMQRIQLFLHLVRLLEGGDLMDTGFEDHFGSVFVAGGMYRVAGALQRHMWTRSSDILGAEHPNTIQAASNLASTYSDLGQYTDAQKLKEQVLEQQTRLLGAEHPKTIRAAGNLAATYSHLGRFADAQKLQEQVLEQQTRLLGAEHPETIGTAGNLALTYQDLGRHTDAQRLGEQVLEQQTRLLGGEHPDTIRAAGNLASTYRALGQYVNAQKLNEQVLEQRTRLLGAEHPDTIWTAGNLAATYRNLGRHADAQKLNEQVLEQRTRLLGAEHPHTIWTAGNLAAIYRDLGQHADAQKLEEKVLEQRTRLLGAEHPDTIWTAGNLALTYQ